MSIYMFFSKVSDQISLDLFDQHSALMSPSDAGKTIVKAHKLKKRTEIEKLYAFIESITAAPKSKLDKAIKYACVFRKDLDRVLEDGRLTLTNNQSERYVKELVMRRKNYLFSSSMEGARTSGHILSIIQTARQNGLNSSKYLQYLFEELPNLPVLTADKLDAYLPWSTSNMQIIE